MLSLIFWLIIGGVAGYFAGKVTNSARPFGVFGDIGLGIVGAIVGGFIIGLLGFSGSGIIPSLITAFIGAVVLIWGFRLFKT